MGTVTLTMPKPHAAQQQVRSEAGRFNVVACGRRWGKSILAAELAVETALEGKPVGVFFPTYKLLEDMWEELTGWLASLGDLVKINQAKHKIEFATGGKIEFWSLENKTGPRSRKYARAIFDEAAYIRDLGSIWTKSVRPVLADYKGDAWFFSSPAGMNDFHRLWAKGGDRDWRSWQMPTVANPHIDPAEVESARQDIPADAFAQEFEAEFLADAANPFGVDAIRRCIRPGLSDADVAAWGVDLAKHTDWTVVIGLDAHGHLRAFQRWQSDWKNTEARLIAMIGNTPACIDSTGVGDPIVERIGAKCSQIEGVKFSKQSKQQMMEGLSVAIQQGLIGYPSDGDCARLVAELEMFRYEYHANGVRYEAPAGEHDDCVDALALAWRCLSRRPTAATFDGGRDTSTPDGPNWVLEYAERDELWK